MKLKAIMKLPKFLGLTERLYNKIRETDISIYVTIKADKVLNTIDNTLGYEGIGTRFTGKEIRKIKTALNKVTITNLIRITGKGDMVTTPNNPD